MSLPNFLVIGAAKAGTTSLAQYLKQHPQIYLNPGWKELRFFAYDGCPPAYRGPGDAQSNAQTIVDLDAYRACFAGAAGRPAIGEVSPVYLYSERAPERIQHYVPEMKLVAVLRNPVDRAYSHFLHLLREDRERLWNFQDALDAEDERVRRNWEWSWHYRRVGLYAEQLRRYLDRFDARQLRVYLYEDFATDPRALFRDLFAFLGVDDGVVPDMSIKHNVSGLPRHATVGRVLFATRRNLKRVLGPARRAIPAGVWRAGATAFWRLYNVGLVKPALDADIHRRLAASYRHDILRLQAMIGRDLSHWLE